MGKVFDAIIYSFTKFFSKEKLTNYKEILISLLKREAVKLALRKLLITSSFGSWIIGYFIYEIFDDYLTPHISTLFRKAGCEIDKQEGRIIIKKLKKAENEKDIDGITGAIDDIYRM